jgi:hypothetical protein
MIPLDFKQICENQELAWFDLFQLDLDQRIAESWFGIEPYRAASLRNSVFPVQRCSPCVDLVDVLNDFSYWAVEFDCGLKVAFEFPDQGYPASVMATEPVAQHVRRHLKHWQSELREYPPGTLELNYTVMLDRFVAKVPELTELCNYQLWRQGDDGNQVAIGVPTTQRDAACWQSELESHKHKQIYWVTRIA